jgi:hypothetical protein
MGPGRKIDRTGLLMMKANGLFRFCITLAFLTLTLIQAAAQNEPQVLVEAVPQIPTAGERWVLSLLVDHGLPDEVDVEVPPFAPSLSLESISKTPRMRGAKIQTVIEYRFTPKTAGVVFIEPFTVTSPSGTTKTNRIVLQIRSSGAEDGIQVLKTVWEGAPAQMAAGQSAVFALRVQASAPLRPRLSLWEVPPPWLPPPEFFMTGIQKGVILAPLPLTIDEREEGIALRLNLIPLEGDFRLEARVLQHENNVYEIPALHIRVTGRAQRSGGTQGAIVSADAHDGGQGDGQDAQNGEQSAAVSKNAPEFPIFDFSALGRSILSKSWSRQCEETYTAAKNLWNSGLYAKALAELRHNERFHTQSALLAQIRREAEESLGLFGTKDESRWQRKLLLGLSFFIIFLVIVTPFVCLLLLRNSFRRRAALICAVVFAVLSSLYFYRFVDTRSVFKGTDGRFAVTYEAPVRRTADVDGEELFRFREGQPVEILLKGDSWIYARTNDASASAGWIEADAVLLY